MDYQRDRSGSKFFFIAAAVVIIYLAFFNFDIKAAYDYFIVSNQWFFDFVGGLF